jgi:hypothetical protein
VTAHVDACLAQHEVRVAEPLVNPFRLEQRGVREHLGWAVGIDQMSAVLRRRGALTVDDNRCRTVTFGEKNFFQTKRQLPVVAIIVAVQLDQDRPRAVATSQFSRVVERPGAFGIAAIDRSGKVQQ